jgi:hypothetical protein
MRAPSRFMASTVRRGRCPGPTARRATDEDATTHLAVVLPGSRSSSSSRLVFELGTCDSHPGPHDDSFANRRRIDRGGAYDRSTGTRPQLLSLLRESGYFEFGGSETKIDPLRRAVIEGRHRISDGARQRAQTLNSCSRLSADSGVGRCVRLYTHGLSVGFRRAQVRRPRRGTLSTRLARGRCCEGVTSGDEVEDDETLTSAICRSIRLEDPAELGVGYSDGGRVAHP